MKLPFKLFFTFSLLFIFVIILNTYFHTLAPYDELWNFHSVYKLYNNYTLYLDFNVIVTPIFYIIGNCFFILFGATINTFRLYNVFIFVLHYTLIFFIFKTLNIKKCLSILYTSLILSHTYSNIAGGANYNILSLNFVLIGIIIYLYRYNHSKYNLYQGIVIFLIFFTKQNLGILYAIGLISFELIDKRISKEFIINQFIKLISFIIPSSLCLTFMYFKGNLFDFVNYAFSGLLEFKNSNALIDSQSLVLFFIIFSTIILYVITARKNEVLSSLEKRNSTFLLILSICVSLIIFPIVNASHIVYAYPLIYLVLFYILDTVFIKEIFYTEKHYTIISLCSVALLFLIIFRILSVVYTNFDKFGKFEKTHPFYNAPFSDELTQKIETISSYIKEKNGIGIDVILISSDSAYIMINLNQNNGAFDLAFNGNLGYNGTQKLINEIENSEDTEFLIYSNEKDLFWQESIPIREYIINNLNKVGEISNYSIYSK